MKFTRKTDRGTKSSSKTIDNHYILSIGKLVTRTRKDLTYYVVYRENDTSNCIVNDAH